MEEEVNPTSPTPLPESSKEELSFQDQTYYCLKIKANLFKNKLFVCGLMFFDLSYDSEDTCTITFIDNPNLMITQHKSEYDEITIKNPWEDFYNLIKEDFEQTYSHNFSLYIQIYEKLRNSYYKKQIKNDIKNKNLEQILEDLKENVIQLLIKTWLLYKHDKHVININLEKVDKASYEQKEQAKNNITNIDQPYRQEKQTKDGEEKDNINWNLDKELDETVVIKNYLPVISINEGVLSKDLEVDDKIFIFLNEEESEKPITFPYPEKKHYPAKIIQKKIDSNKSLRLLVLLEDNSYGDVEIYDSFFKVKKVIDNDEKNNKKKKSEEPFLKPFFFFNFFLIVIFIVILYLLIKQILF